MSEKMKVELVTKDNFAEGVGQSKVYHCFLSLDGIRLEQVLKFGKLCKDAQTLN